jgi:hypothetical protein
MSELKGFFREKPGYKQEDYHYRILKVYATFAEVSIQPGYGTTTNMIKEEFRKSDRFEEYPFLMNYSLVRIEDHLDTMSAKRESTLCTIRQTLKELFPEETVDHPVTIYLFYEDLAQLYANIRQKAIDHLMNI